MWCEMLLPSQAKEGSAKSPGWLVSVSEMAQTDGRGETGHRLEAPAAT